MKRIFLRALNAPFFVMILAIALAISSAVFRYYPFHYFQPDLILLAVVWCALQRRFTEGGILTILFSLIGEAHSATPGGLFIFCYMTIYLFIRLAAKLIVLSQRTHLIITTMFSSVLWKVLHLLVLVFMDAADQQWRHTLLLLVPSTAVSGGLALVIFPLLDEFDRITFKTERSRQLLEDEILMEEGI